MPGGPARRPHRVCFIPVSLASTWGLMRSFLPCNSPAGCSCDVPSVRLSGHWPRPPDTCLTCLTRAMRVASSMWSLCGPGAGGRAWVHLGGRLGPSIGTDPWSQGDCQWGVGCCHVEQISDGGVAAAPGNLSMNRVSLKVLGPEHQVLRRPRKGRLRPVLQLRPPSTATGHCQSQTFGLQSQISVPCLGQHATALEIRTQKEVLQQAP